MEFPLHIASYNIHKGLSQFNRRLTVHELRDRLGTLGTDIVFLQEVQHSHGLRASRFQHWPGRPQHEFLAGHVYTDFAYGKNCVYDTGHHGNAILSRYKILSWENEDSGRTRTVPPMRTKAAACCSARSKCRGWRRRFTASTCTWR